MTSTEQQQRKFFQRTGLAFQGLTFERAMQVESIRIAIACGVKASGKGKPAPSQPDLFGSAS